MSSKADPPQSLELTETETNEKLNPEPESCNVADTSLKPAEEGVAAATESLEEEEEEEEEEAVILTYEGSKMSQAYARAKASLSAGEFELAMEEIETELMKKVSLLGNAEFHECLAPLYYLYGTTLLYSVEESTDTSVMQQQQQQQEDGGEEAGDLQIAWENLELSRSILSGMTHRNNEQELDLAQVHMRLGDLQRANGNYAEAVDDYQHAHNLRKQTLTNYYDRRIADTLYSLGMCCLLLAAEAEKKASLPEQPELPAGITLPPDNTTTVPPSLTPEKIVEYRERSILHYLECARVLVGIMAKLCGKDAATEAHIEAVKLPPSHKTITPTVEYASQSLNSLRTRTQTMVAKMLQDGCEDTNMTQVTDLNEMLDEIQEVIDNTEQDQQGLQTVGAMKKMAEAQAEQEDDDQKKPAAQTTIGFGTTTTTTTAAVAPNSMLVVKKKKKRDDPSSQPDAKKPKAS